MVSLPVLYGPQPDKPVYRHGEALNLTQEVHGVLNGWLKATDGRWYGVVTFSVPYLGLVPSIGLQLTDQLVPAEALRPRDYGSARK